MIDGIAAASAAGTVLLVALYSLYAPTRDLRARLPILLEVGGGLLTLVALVGFVLGGILVLTVLGSQSRVALLGVVVGAFANTLVLVSGALSVVLPAVERPVLRWVAVFGGVALSTALIRRRRTSRRRSKREDPAPG
jgi:hypothetical protein